MKRAYRRNLTKTKFFTITKALISERFISSDEMKASLFTKLRKSVDLYRLMRFCPAEAAFHFAGMNRLPFNKASGVTDKKNPQGDHDGRFTEELPQEDV